MRLHRGAARLRQGRAGGAGHPGGARDLRGFVLDIASYVLEQDVTLRDGETIGFSEGQKLPITRSAGIWHDGMTLKIGYPSKEEGRTRTAERPET